MNKTIGIIGAGPAGLTAAYRLIQAGFEVHVFEMDDQYVGGISRTESYNGFHFDIGGHRFFSKSKEVEDFWKEILADDLITRNRKSRIYYQGKFYSYPLRAFEALRNLGLWTSFLCMMSYTRAKIFPNKDPKNLEEWVSGQFGKRLYQIFFKTYTEKVWGMDCREISADWAAQRIKGLSLGKAIYNALFVRSQNHKESGKVIKTLIDTFRYPRKGPGMMWDTCRDKFIKMGGKISMSSEVTKIEKKDKWNLHTANGQTYLFDEVISSMPLRYLMTGLQPEVSAKAEKAANSIRYRDFLTVVLITEDKDYFDDNWIYIHDPQVQVGRIQNFKSWSPEMVPDQKYNCYGLEYFCFEGDNLWTMKDEDLINLGKKEMKQLHLIDDDKVTDAYVVRQPKAYPVYDESYKHQIAVIREELKNYEGLQVIGRNGMHKYNNQDHSMMTAMLAAENIKKGQTIYDVWKVNEDAEYHESGEAGEDSFTAGRDVPKPI